MNNSNLKLDRVDRKILEALQADGRLSSAELADMVVVGLLGSAGGHK